MKYTLGFNENEDLQNFLNLILGNINNSTRCTSSDFCGHTSSGYKNKRRADLDWLYHSWLGRWTNTRSSSSKSIARINYIISNYLTFKILHFIDSVANLIVINISSWIKDIHIIFMFWKSIMCHYLTYSESKKSNKAPSLYSNLSSIIAF